MSCGHLGTELAGTVNVGGRGGARCVNGFDTPTPTPPRRGEGELIGLGTPTSSSGLRGVGKGSQPS